MMSKIWLALAGIAVVGFLCVTMGATSQTGGPAAVFEVISVERRATLEGADSTISFEDPTAVNAAILTVRVTAAEDVELWAPDFSLAYAHGTKTDDRSRCVAMATAVTSLDDEGAWLVSGDYMHVTVKKGVRHVKLLFGLETDAHEVSLQYAQPVVHGIKVPAL